MVTSDLYKTGRLVNADDFIIRVSAAAVLHAATSLTTLTGNQKNLAVATLLNPMVPEQSMVALVASDPGVLAQTTLDGPLPLLEELPDAEVKRVVAAKWGIVAAKYPNDPTPKAAAV